ncbi:unnamed protein product [Zymoseptoria tritici ST99CH_3D1]|uniref:NAD(P)-binding protein n=2 Tax=Zymoseptoria tritici TaxID=1047171 RepID=A0A1X7RYS2_ZYMT9|nr:unnamed protein product [Zymoseptoria tritici ST99CH_3D7]SMR55399.1 unnamed protein product [Zymoseptoria tritici ST99CH_1E4]SMR57776.1 unnamed protein product [Zymoseptoria tritici ST99CH_3D1]
MGQFALITGCGSGIGRALALEFASRGIRTITTARQPSALKELAELHENIVPIAVDVQEPETILALKKQVERITEGHLHYLVNNAGIHYASPGTDIDTAMVQELFNVNVVAVMSMVREFAPLLIAAKGVIVQIGSVTRAVPAIWQGPYNATKAALSQCSKTLRLELEPFGDHIETFKAQGNKTGMPAATYARRVANQVTRGNPPHEFWDGGGAWVMFLIVSVLPSWLSQRIWRSYFKLDLLRARR